MSGSKVFHVAIADDWEMSQGLGSYEASTRGHALADDGFIRASTAGQLQGVLDDHYADLELPLLVVVIDAERLAASGVSVEWPSEGSGPHLLGPIPPGDASIVLDVRPVRREGGRWIAPSELED
ncbi:MAG: DUF952 domain-containing protein [Actinomycetota bacterium]|nr:DUF952 domain-containing protein [Actinomycetota bacterium]